MSTHCQRSKCNTFFAKCMRKCTNTNATTQKNKPHKCSNSRANPDFYLHVNDQYVPLSPGDGALLLLLLLWLWLWW